MSADEAVRLALVLLSIGGAAIVKGVTGFGFPLVAAPLISIVLDPRSAVLILSLVSIFGNVGIMFRGGGNHPTLRRLAPTIGGLLVGTVIGAQFVASVDPVALGLVVGACTLLFATVSMLRPNLVVPPRLERHLAVPMGLGGGLLGGSTSIFAPLIASYLLSLKLEKREFVFFVTLLYTVGGAVQIASYALLGLYDRAVLLIVLAALIPNALGISLGLRLQAKVDPITFRRLVLGLIFCTGLSLVIKGLWR